MPPVRRRFERWLTHDRRVLLMSLLAGLPGSGVALILLWRGDFTPKVQWTLTLFIVGLWWGVSSALRERVVYPLQTLSNLLAALREEDFSIRARGQRKDDALGEVLIEMNALAETLREQRLGALEATSLLRTVMEEIPVAVFSFDPERRLRLANRAGERLLARPIERLLGRTADELGLGGFPRHRRPIDRRRHLPRRHRPLGGAHWPFPAGRHPARTARHDRRQPVAARRGAAGVATADSRHRARNQQFAGADQIDLAQP